MTDHAAPRRDPAPAPLSAILPNPPARPSRPPAPPPVTARLPIEMTIDGVALTTTKFGPIAVPPPGAGLTTFMMA